jgi:hypothetical protein
MFGMTDEALFRPTLALADQARFTVGYYHQRNDLYQPKKKAEEDGIGE